MGDNKYKYIIYCFSGLGELEVGIGRHRSHVIVSKLVGEDVKTLLDRQTFQ